MSLRSHSIVALLMMRAKPVRAFLSLLGIYIGVLTLVVILSVREGTKRMLEDALRTEGAAVLFLSNGFDPATQRVGALSVDEATAIGAAPGVISVLPRVNVSKEAHTDEKRASFPFVGVDADSLNIYRVPILQGRSFLPEEVRTRQPVCVLTEKAAQELFPLGRAVGGRVSVENDSLEVIGVAAWNAGIARRANLSLEGSGVLVPATWLLRDQGAGAHLDMLELRVVASAPVESVIEGVRRQLSKGDPALGRLYNFSSAEDYLKDLQESNARTLRSLLGIAAVSLLVGGIGVANVMLTSVTERTREIGVRKALGARRKDILLQFLVEASLMTSASGLLAVATGWGGAAVLPYFVETGFKLTVTAPIVVGVFLLTCAVGLIAGLYPASRAAALAPAAALRYE